MRRITIWITATLTVVALVIAYQWNLAGGGKDGEGRDEQTAVVCPATPSEDGGTTSPCPPDANANSDHTGKPGESK
jgi:hypothetical protein